MAAMERGAGPPEAAPHPTLAGTVAAMWRRVIGGLLPAAALSVAALVFTVFLGGLDQTADGRERLGQSVLRGSRRGDRVPGATPTAGSARDGGGVAKVCNRCLPPAARAAAAATAGGLAVGADPLAVGQVGGVFQCPGVGGADFGQVDDARIAVRRRSHLRTARGRHWRWRPPAALARTVPAASR